MATESHEPHFVTSGFSYPFKDPQRASKLVIGSLLILASLIVPLLPLFFVAGYNLKIIQPILRGDGKATLPEWDDWSWLLKHGFKLSEAGLFYALPGLILLTVGYGMLFFPLFELSFAGIVTGTPQPVTEQAAAILTKGATLTGIAALLTLVGGFFSMPAAMHMAARDDIKAIFQIREWGGILSRALGKFALAYGLIATSLILVSIIFTILSATIVLCIPAALIFSIVVSYLSFVASALFASAYRAGSTQNLN